MSISKPDYYTLHYNQQKKLNGDIFNYTVRHNPGGATHAYYQHSEPTRYVHLTVPDTRQQSGIDTSLQYKGRGPPSVDIESELFNRTRKLSANGSNVYVPSSRSDLYVPSTHMSRPPANHNNTNHPYLFDSYDPPSVNRSTNPSRFDNMFENHTRVQRNSNF